MTRPSEHPGDGIEPWERFVSATTNKGDAASTPYTLAAICFLVDPTVPTPEEQDTEGLPRGRPDRATIRAAATSLLTYASSRQDDVGAVWTMLGTLQRSRYFRGSLGEQADDLDRLVAGLTLTVDLAAQIGPEFAAWVHLRLASLLRDGLRDAESLEAADRAIDILRSVSVVHDGPHPALASATGGRAFVPTHQRLIQLLTYRAHARAGVATRMLRDYSRAAAEWDLAIETALQMPDRPVICTAAYGERATVARTLGDIAASRNLLARQEILARESGSAIAWAGHLKSSASSAVFLDDWASALELRFERMRLRCRLDLEWELDPTPAHLLAAVDEMRVRGRRAGLTAVGNDAYEVARYLIDSGRAQLDEAARHSAQAWLDVADTAWHDIALNGKIAIRFRETELEALTRPGTDRRRLGRRMVALSREWRRVVGRRRGALKAVHYGEPGDPVLLQRLEELMHGAPAVDVAHLKAGVAQWHLSNGDVARDRGDTALAIREWRTAVDEAHAASVGLAVRRHGAAEVSLDPAATVQARVTQCTALRRLRETILEDAQHLARAELDARLSTLPAVARRLTAHGHPGQRAVLEQTYRTWLNETMELSVELQDFDAADVAAEVVRRDLVGTVLYGIAADPVAPRQMAALASRLTDALAATVFDTDDSPQPTSEPDANEDGDTGDEATMRATMLAEQVHDALDVVGEVLGPVAQNLFDPDSVTRHTARSAAAALFNEGPGAVLSLVLLRTDGGARVMRRLCWRPPGEHTLREHLDMVPVPEWVAGITNDGDPHEFFARLEPLSKHLIPLPLAELLDGASPDSPIPLAIVPTGLFAVPFAALRVGDSLLLDRASVSVVQSLQTLETLAQTHVPPEISAVKIGAFDVQRLEHAKSEWDALLQHHPLTVAAHSLEDMDAMLGGETVSSRPGLLAMALHGARGTSGWTQAKQLPSGQHLTTGHVLRWCVPTLVVGASCNTDIRADTGGELGGFPMAFQLRGAVNIIGALHYIEDDATARIMSTFYEATARGVPSAAALRLAQRQWIASGSTRRLWDYQRWALLVAYGLPHR